MVLHLSDGELRWRKPVVYQEQDGTRQTIDGHYVVRRGHRVSFELGTYDRRRALIIDPSLAYSALFGGRSGESGIDAVAVDSAGNTYVTGYTRADDFPVTQGAFQTTCPSGSQCSTWGAAFITKMNPSGTGLVYSTYLGGNEGAYGQAIAIDATGDAYVTGQTYSTDFPTTPGAFQTTCNTCAYNSSFGDAFVTELNPTGSALVASTYLGGDPAGLVGSVGEAITIGASGYVYAAGYTSFTGFPTTPSAFQTKCGGCGTAVDDGFITAFNPGLSTLSYSTYLGGSGNDDITGIALDVNGDVYATGETESTDFPVTSGAFQTSCSQPSCWDAFVTKLNPTGSALIYSTYLGGSITSGEAQYGTAVVIDPNDDAYVTGTTGSATFPTTPGVFQPTCHSCPGGENTFVAEFNPSGSALIYSTYLGGSLYDFALAIALDALGDVYLDGETFSIDFPTTPDAFQTCSGCPIGVYRGFVSELSPGGSDLVYSTYLTGSDGSACTGIALDTAGGIYIVGGASSDFPTTPGAFQTQCGSCGFVTKFLASGQPTVQFNPTNLNFGNETVGMRSSQMVSTLINEGGTLTITKIELTGANRGDVSETNNCPGSLPPNNTCSITVTFTPKGTGTRNAAVSVTDNGENSPQSLPLVGVGVLPAVMLSPTSLTFPTRVVYTTSPPQKVTLTNTGLGLLEIRSATVSPQFGVTTTCGKTLDPGASCTAEVRFKPTMKGPISGSITLTDNAPDSPQQVALSGTATFVQLSPTSLNFGNQPVNSTSPPKYITLENKGNAPLNFTGSGITLSGADPQDFAEQNNCGNSLPSGGYCRIKVTFTPTEQGKRTADVSISDDGGASPQLVPLVGTGTP